ncbi:DNA-processing protein DprA, partial [Sulfitobacter sp. HI0021]
MTDKDLHPSSTHPPLPPTQEDEQFARLRLLRSRRVGISTYRRLLDEHGSAINALIALPEVAQAAGISDYRICPEGVVQAELNAARTAGARLLVQGQAPYPDLLNDLDDAPPFLWMIGDPSLLTRPMISLVGARNASSLGLRMARTLAAELGEAGFVVVSGLARGIDAAAHSAALAHGTIAVQAGGVDIIYPSENAELAEQIAAQGLRLSEQPIGLQPMARHFPRRNRIISGLSRATVVVEAAARSGSLITARDALDQGRDVLAVPGHPMDARAAGCNMLIRDGAVLVRSAADVLEVLPELATQGPELPRRKPAPPPLRAKTPPPNRGPVAKLHAQILARLGPAPVAEDQLIRDLQVPSSDV